MVSETISIIPAMADEEQANGHKANGHKANGHKHQNGHAISASSKSQAVRPQPYISSREEYERMYKQSIDEPDAFWRSQALDLIEWHMPFKTVYLGDFASGVNAWFPDGFLSPCHNLVDRHAIKDRNKVALMYDADDTRRSRDITYGELLTRVCQLASLLRQLGVRKGDIVTIYMPMVPEAIIAMLATIRIGALHSVVFAGFSCESLAERITHANSHVVITADEGCRGGRRIATKRIVDEALGLCDCVEHTIVLQHTGGPVPWKKSRDIWWHESVPKQPPFIPAEVMNAEDPLFVLYTSGSTGKPKALLHTVGGYLLGAACTTKYVFDVHPEDRFGCAGDIGWITGHTYIVYGPLMLGASTLIFESTPSYPDYSRYWQTVERLRLTQWYIAPTAIRMLKKAGEEFVRGDRSSLRILGTVGEPISPEVFEWYEQVVGEGRCVVVDTFWQTETGSHIIAPIPFAIKTKPGSATVPFFGIKPVLLDPQDGHEIKENNVEGVLCIKQPWPSLARTILNSHNRYMNAYFVPYDGYYFTGDSAYRDDDGYLWINGRVDDVVNVAGHRLSTAEVEASLVRYPGVVEAAAVGFADDISGQAICAFVSVKTGVSASDAFLRELVVQVRQQIGPFAAPKEIFFTELPKTRSGKIMRRVLRKIVNGEGDQLGDLSTLSNPDVVGDIKDVVHERLGHTFKNAMHSHIITEYQKPEDIIAERKRRESVKLAARMVSGPDGL